MSTIIVSTSLTTLAIPASAATAPSKESSVSSGVNKISTKQLIDAIQPYVVVDENGKISLSSSIPNEFYGKYDLNSLESWFATLNKQASAGKIEIKDDLTIKENKDMSKPNKIETAAGGISPDCDDTCYRNTYWWGQSIGYCKPCAKLAISESKGGAIKTLKVLGFISGPGGAFVTTITTDWFIDLADAMKDALTDDGVVVDMNYTLSYNCYGR